MRQKGTRRTGQRVQIRPRVRCPNPCHNPDCEGHCAIGSSTCRSCGHKHGAAVSKVKRVLRKLEAEGKSVRNLKFRIANDFDISTWDPDQVDEVTRFVVEELLKR